MEIGESCGVASLCSSSLSCPARRTVGAGRGASPKKTRNRPACFSLVLRDLGILGVCVCDSRDLGILRLVGAFALCTSATLEEHHSWRPSNQKTIFCLATLLSRLLMLRSAVRGLRLIDTPRRGARDLSCLHGRDCAALKVRASVSEVKDGGGYGHPLTHEPVFQRDKRIIERLASSFDDSAPRKCRPEAAAPETGCQPLPFSN